MSSKLIEYRHVFDIILAAHCHYVHLERIKDTNATKFSIHISKSSLLYAIYMPNFDLLKT
jgi:hypothetical protein